MIRDFSYNVESFDVTPIIQKYKGKKLEELFPNHQIVENDLGEFMELYWEENDVRDDFNLSTTKKNILYNLKTVFYIGENVESNLVRRGVRSLIDLKYNLRFSRSASEILELIRKKDYISLSANKNIYDLDLSFCFEIEDLLFFDIETLGLYDSPMIIVGIGFFKNGKFNIRLFFARKLEEEIAICEHLKSKVLPNFKSFITYNGKSFDIPCLANRFLYFFEENPMISKEDTPFKDINTKYHHIDLYHNCRRKFKGIYQSFTLTKMEVELLKWLRKNELPSSMVGQCYKKYQKNPERYIGLVKEAIEHNFFDILSLPMIFQKLLNS